MTRLAAVAIAVAGLAFPAASAAATRYAAPAGTGTDCSQAAPCSLSSAFTSLGANTEIVLASGTYGSSSSPLASLSTTAPGVSLHGAADGHHPHIYVSGPGLELGGPGSSVAGVEVENPLTAPTGAALTVGQNAHVDRTFVHSAADVTDPINQSAAACLSDTGSTWTSSICWAPTANAMILHDGTTTLRNVTLDSANGFYALYVDPTSTGTVNATNIIVLGGCYLQPGATFNYDHSDIGGGFAGPGTSVNGGSNTTVAPALVDPDHGDFHETALSGSTIDQGAPTDGLDVDDDARLIGSATDIGADERAGPAAATTDPVSTVDQTTATVSGAIDRGGSPTTFHFEYGPTTSYGTSTSDDGLGGGTDIAHVQAQLTGLAPATTYHVRLVVSNPQGPAASPDVSFTTAAVPPPAPSAGPTPTAPAPAPALIVLDPAHPAVAVTAPPSSGVPVGTDGLAPFTFTNNTDQALVADVELVSRTTAARSKALTSVLHKTVAARQKASFRLKLTSAARRALKHHKLKATLVVKLRSPGGVRVTVTKPVTLKRKA